MYAYGAERCADEMWHSWFRFGTEYDNIDGENVGPAPGFLAGGPNPQGNDAMPVKVGTEQFDATAGEQPHQKAFSVNNDANASFGPWAYNEPAIYYNGNYVRALSFFAAGEVGGVDTAELGATGETFEAGDIQTGGNPETAPSTRASGGAIVPVGSFGTGASFAFTPLDGGAKQITLRVGRLGSDYQEARVEAGNYDIEVNGQRVGFTLDTTTVAFGGAGGFGTLVSDEVTMSADTTVMLVVRYVAPADGGGAVDLISYRDPRAIPMADDTAVGAVVCGEAEAAFTVLNDTGGNGAVERDGSSPGSSGAASVKLFDAGDEARVPFETAAAGRYEVRVRVRTGEAAADSPSNLVDEYVLRLDGEPVTGTLDASTLSELANDTY